MDYEKKFTEEEQEALNTLSDTSSGEAETKQILKTSLPQMGLDASVESTMDALKTEPGVSEDLVKEIFKNPKLVAHAAALGLRELEIGTGVEGEDLPKITFMDRVFQLQQEGRKDLFSDGLTKSLEAYKAGVSAPQPPSKEAGVGDAEGGQPRGTPTEIKADSSRPVNPPPRIPPNPPQAVQEGERTTEALTERRAAPEPSQAPPTKGDLTSRLAKAPVAQAMTGGLSSATRGYVKSRPKFLKYLSGALLAFGVTVGSPMLIAMGVFALIKAFRKAPKGKDRTPQTIQAFRTGEEDKATASIEQSSKQGVQLPSRPRIPALVAKLKQAITTQGVSTPPPAGIVSPLDLTGLGTQAHVRSVTTAAQGAQANPPSESAVESAQPAQPAQPAAEATTPKAPAKEPISTIDKETAEALKTAMKDKKPEEFHDTLTDFFKDREDITLPTHEEIKELLKPSKPGEKSPTQIQSSEHLVDAVVYMNAPQPITLDLRSTLIVKEDSKLRKDDKNRNPELAPDILKTVTEPSTPRTAQQTPAKSSRKTPGGTAMG